MSHLSLEDQVIVCLRRIARAIALHSRGLMHETGLTAPQLAALQAIAKLQPITIGGLAKSIHLSQATLTGILTRLESRNFVSRARSGMDRRAVVVELTEAGRAAIASAPSLLQARFRRELHKLQEWEQTQTLSVLQRVASMMEADESDTLALLTADSAAAKPEDLPQLLDIASTSVSRDKASSESSK